MSTRLLHAQDAAPGSAAAWAVGLAAALDGSGPALTPIPVGGPAAARAELLGSLRPDDVAVPLESADVALVVPTSGSTGAAKGVLLTAAALQASARATHERLGGVGRWVLALPLTHVAGLMVVVRSLSAGGPPTEVPLGGFDPAAFAVATAAAAHAARADGLPLYASLVPTQLQRCLDAGVDLSAYAALLVGAAATPAELLRRAAAAGARVVTTYGMSETCGGCVYDGVPLDGVGVDLDAGGRVHLSGPTLFAGYRLRPDLTHEALDAAGRFVTSDLGHFDAAGRLEVDGRVDDMIISGGENVAPALVEAAIGRLPGVLSCAVVGVPDPHWGERVVALVVPQAGSPQPDLTRLRAELVDLPAAARPQGLVLLDAIPLLATGKPDRSTLRLLAAGDYAGAHPTYAEES